MALPLSSPLAEGVDPAGLLALVEAMDQPGSGYQTLMIARHGRVIARGAWAPYQLDRVHLVYSVSKSFTATVVGQLVDAGRLDLDRPVWSYLRPDWERLAAPWPRVLVRHCLSMTVGHRQDSWGPHLWAAYGVAAGPEDDDPFLDLLAGLVPDGEPGQTWAYNQTATYLLAQAMHSVTGRRLTDLVRDGVLGPLGETKLTAQRTPQGRDLGYSGLAVTTPAILGIAQTYLDGGRYRHHQVVSGDWVRQAQLPVAASLGLPDRDGDWGQGYGFSLWNQRHGFRGDGAFGQFCVVLPELDMVVAITSEHDPMQDTLDLLFDHLLAACDRPGDPDVEEQLRDRLLGLRIGARAGSAAESSPLLPETSSANVGLGELRLLVVEGRQWLAGRAGRIPIGSGEWLPGSLTFPAGPLPVVASGGWAGHRFTAEIRVIETPHTGTLSAAAGDPHYAFTWNQVPLTGPSLEQLVGQP